jgi:hypothetical protein
MRDDGDDPCCGNGVEGLQGVKSGANSSLNYVGVVFVTYEVAGKVEDVGGHGEGRLCRDLFKQLPRTGQKCLIFVL